MAAARLLKRLQMARPSNARCALENMFGYVRVVAGRLAGEITYWRPPGKQARRHGCRALTCIIPHRAILPSGAQISIYDACCFCSLLSDAALPEAFSHLWGPQGLCIFLAALSELFFGLLLYPTFHDFRVCLKCKLTFVRT